jgi:hypothetical protein
MKAGLLVVAVLSGCGYRFVVPYAALQGGVMSVRVPLFQNQTAEPAAEYFFTEAAKAQLERAGVLGGDGADGQLEGTITGISSSPMLTSPVLPLQPVFRVTASLALTLKRHNVVVGTTQVSVSEEYPSGADVLLTESNRGAAVRRMADSALREGLDRFRVWN